MNISDARTNVLLSVTAVTVVLVFVLLFITKSPTLTFELNDADESSKTLIVLVDVVVPFAISLCTFILNSLSDCGAKKFKSTYSQKSLQVPS